MKRRYLTFLLVLVPTLLVMGAPAKAEAFAGDQLRVNVPFRFVVGETVLPAGRYNVRASDMSPAVIWLVSPSGHHIAVVSTEWGDPVFDGSKPDLRFEVYGGTRFLSEVQIPGEGTQMVPLTRNEMQDELAHLAAQHVSHGKA